MKKAIKITAYVIACIAVFFIISEAYKKTVVDTNQASAFEWEKTVKVYFPNSNMGSNEDCKKVFPVSRTVLNAETLGPGALDALLRGVTPEEVSSGYLTSLNSGILVNKFDIQNGIARVDFNDSLSDGVAGSCRVESIKSQIEQTLNDLIDIDSVVISINGKTEGILEP